MKVDSRRVFRYLNIFCKFYRWCYNSDCTMVDLQFLEITSSHMEALSSWNSINFMKGFRGFDIWQQTQTRFSAAFSEKMNSLRNPQIFLFARRNDICPFNWQPSFQVLGVPSQKALYIAFVLIRFLNVLLSLSRNRGILAKTYFRIHPQWCQFPTHYLCWGRNVGYISVCNRPWNIKCQLNRHWNISPSTSDCWEFHIC